MRVLLSLAIAAVGIAHAQNVPDSSYERTFKTAYLFQGNPSYGPDGRMYCGPVAAVMEFSRLAENGYPNLLPKAGTAINSLHQSVIMLASTDYMGTSAEDGTGTSDVIKGALRYVKEAGYEVSDVEYAGWRGPRKGIPCNIFSKTVSFDLLRMGVNQSNTMVLMNVGYYNQVQQGVWQRQGGHWVAVVGYGTDGQGKQDNNVLLVHNPGLHNPKPLPTSADLGQRLAQDVAKVETFQGTLILKNGKVGPLTCTTYAVEGPSIPKAKKFDGTFIDGFVTITLAPAK